MNNDEECLIVSAGLCFSCEHNASMNTNYASSSVRGTDMFAPPQLIVPEHWQKTEQSKLNKKKGKKKKPNKYRVDGTEVRMHLDGLLFFPDIGILIHPDLGHFDSSLCISNSTSEPGLPHMVITPLNAFHLEASGAFPQGSANEIELLHDDFMVKYDHPADQSMSVTRKVEVVIVDSKCAAKWIRSKKEKGHDWVDESEMQRSVGYLGQQHISDARSRGIDVIAILATP